jgi:hypothetical protein
MEQVREALKKLNVFARMPRKAVRKAMFSKVRLDTLSDGIFAVAMTLLILDVRCRRIFIPRTARRSCTASPASGRNSCLTS